jgi:hypothetical protein
MAEQVQGTESFSLELGETILTHVSTQLREVNDIGELFLTTHKLVFVGQSSLEVPLKQIKGIRMLCTLVPS